MAIRKSEGKAKLAGENKLQKQSIGTHKSGPKKAIASNKETSGDKAGNITLEEPAGAIYISGKPKQMLAQVSYDWNDDVRGLELVTLIRDGIDYKTFEIVAARTPLKDKDWAQVLDTTLRTLIRYKKDNKTFAPKQTEKIIEIQQLMQYGEEVFGDIASFHAWLRMHNVALGGISPKELLDTSVGLGIVKDSLGRIEHGILA
tara:strand:+ start:4646 stop:5251 length:606 start_codon:yes stop_codon:yes gene_type:complete